MKLKRLIALAIAAASILGMSTQASALTGWLMFAYARDYYYPYVSFSAGAVNPEYLQVAVNDGSFTGPSFVSVSIRCRDADYNSWDRSIGQNVWGIPRSWVWDIPTWVTYCSVRVSAYNDSLGWLSASAWARYP